MECQGTHSYFVAETVGIPDEGRIVIVALCTHCGDTLVKGFKISKQVSELKLGTHEQINKE